MVSNKTPQPWMCCVMVVLVSFLQLSDALGKSRLKLKRIPKMRTLDDKRFVLTLAPSVPPVAFERYDGDFENPGTWWTETVELVNTTGTYSFDSGIVCDTGNTCGAPNTIAPTSGTYAAYFGTIPATDSEKETATLQYGEVGTVRLDFTTTEPHITSVATLTFSIRQFSCDNTNKYPDNFTIAIGGSTVYSETHVANAALSRCGEGSYRTETVDLSNYLSGWQATVQTMTIQAETSFVNQRTSWWFDDIYITMDSPPYITDITEGSSSLNQTTQNVYPSSIVIEVDEPISLHGSNTIVINDGTNSVALTSADVGSGVAITNVAMDSASITITSATALSSINMCASGTHTITINDNSLVGAGGLTHTEFYASWEVRLLEILSYTVGADAADTAEERCALSEFADVTITFNTDITFEGTPTFFFSDGVLEWNLPITGDTAVAISGAAFTLDSLAVGNLTNFNAVGGAYKLVIPAGAIKAVDSGCPTTSAITLTWGQPYQTSYTPTMMCANQRDNPLQITMEAPVRTVSGGTINFWDGSDYSVNVSLVHSSITVSGQLISIDLADSVYEPLDDTTNWWFKINANSLKLTSSDCTHAADLPSNELTIYKPPAWDLTDGTFTPNPPIGHTAVFDRALVKLVYDGDIEFTSTAVISLTQGSTVLYLQSDDAALSITDGNTVQIDLQALTDIDVDDAQITTLVVELGSIRNATNQCVRNFIDTVELNSTCGNGFVDGAETCDTAAGAGQNCIQTGYASGDTSCKSNCAEIEDNACVAHDGIGGHDESGFAISDLGVGYLTWFDEVVDQDNAGSYATQFCSTPASNCNEAAATTANIRPYPHSSGGSYNINSNIWTVTNLVSTGWAANFNYGLVDDTTWINPAPFALISTSHTANPGISFDAVAGGRTLVITPGRVDNGGGNPGVGLFTDNGLQFRIVNRVNQKITGFEIRCHFGVTQLGTPRITSLDSVTYHEASSRITIPAFTALPIGGTSTDHVAGLSQYTRVWIEEGVNVDTGENFYLTFNFKCPGCGTNNIAAPEAGDHWRFWRLDIVPYLSTTSDKAWDKPTPDANTLVVSNLHVNATESWTIETWVYPMQYAHGVSQDLGCCGNWVSPKVEIDDQILLYSSASGTYLNLTKTTGGWYLTLGVSGGWSQTWTSMLIQPEKWQHIAIAFTKNVANALGDYMVYLDGSIQGSTTGAAAVEWGGASPTDTICIGNWDCVTPATDMGFTGIIDEFRIWNQAQSSDTIEDYMQTQPLVTAADGLILYLQFTSVVTSTTGTANVAILNSVTSGATKQYVPITPLVLSVFAGGTVSCADSYVKTGATVVCNVTIASSDGTLQAAPSTSYVTVDVNGRGTLSTLTWATSLKYATFTFTSHSALTGTSTISAKAANIPFGNTVQITTITEACKGCEFRKALGPGCDNGFDPPECIDSLNTFPAGCCNRYYSCSVAGVQFVKRNIRAIAGTCPA